MTLKAAIQTLETEVARPDGELNKLKIESLLSQIEQSVPGHPDIPLDIFAAMSPLSRRTAVLALSAAWRQYIR